MKPASSFFKMLAYPITRPLRDVASSLRGIKGTAQDARQRLAEKRSDADAASAYLKGLTPRERFDEVFTMNKWTEEDVLAQASAAKRTRLGSLALAVLVLPLMIWIVLNANFFVAILSAIGAIVLTAACLAQATRFAWWESQIERRELCPLGEFIAREDLFKRVFLP